MATTIDDQIMIRLAPRQREWLQKALASGDYATVDEAVNDAIALMEDDSDPDLGWVKPYLDEAREQVARGETVSLEEFKKRNRDRYGDDG